jgi:hypothetical protein
MAGMTDYSHQSYDDMVVDLKNWVKNLREVCETLEKSRRKLDENDYWERVGFNVRATLRYSQKFFGTSIIEINSILADFENEVQSNHVTRLRSLSHTASDINDNLGQVWHDEPWEWNKEYGDPNFNLVEHMYSDARGMVADMLDLDNLAARLQDFIGKRGKQYDTSENNLTNVHPPLVVSSANINKDKPDWTEFTNTIGIYAQWAIGSLIDAFFLFLWVIIQWLLNIFIVPLRLNSFDNLVLSIFQVLFAISTLAPIAITIYQNIRIKLLRTQRKIRQENKIGEAHEPDEF